MSVQNPETYSRRKLTRREKIQALAVGAILVFMVAGIVVQQTQINDLRQEVNELLEISQGNDNSSRGTHATVYYTVRRHGEVIYTFADENVITNAGRVALTGHIGDTAIAVFDYIQVGTGTGGDAASTDLVTPFSTRGQGTYAYVASYNFTITYEFAPGFFGGETITETGCFNAVTGVTMLSYDDSFSRTLTSSDSLEIVFNFQVGS